MGLLTIFGIVMGFFLTCALIWQGYTWMMVSKRERATMTQKELLQHRMESLEDMTVKELTDMARERGLKGYSKLNKADLIASLIKQG